MLFTCSHRSNCRKFWQDPADIYIFNHNIIKIKQQCSTKTGYSTTSCWWVRLFWSLQRSQIPLLLVSILCFFSLFTKDSALDFFLSFLSRQGEFPFKMLNYTNKSWRDPAITALLPLRFPQTGMTSSSHSKMYNRNTDKQQNKEDLPAYNLRVETYSVLKLEGPSLAFSL